MEVLLHIFEGPPLASHGGLHLGSGLALGLGLGLGLESGSGLGLRLGLRGEKTVTIQDEQLTALLMARLSISARDLDLGAQI